MCAEPRDGVLYVFMPPVEALEDYLELVGAVEATSRALGMRVMLEGYPPPHDPRLPHFLVTPDPGVIEVNMQPAGNWDQLVEQTTALYDEAQARRAHAREVHARRPPHRDRRRQSLRAGRRVAGRQPVPAAPDLLRSLRRLLAQPSVAVVPVLRAVSSARPARRRASTRRATTASTSWRSRSRASRRRTAARPPPWLVDRVLRHLLVDVTGNTHRAEFCIDKLYSPDLVVGPARPARAARLRDAAARAHEPRAAAAAARA